LRIIIAVAPANGVAPLVPLNDEDDVVDVVLAASVLVGNRS
jgi:hypothetical protein